MLLHKAIQLPSIQKFPVLNCMMVSFFHFLFVLSMISIIKLITEHRFTNFFRVLIEGNTFVFYLKRNTSREKKTI